MSEVIMPKMGDAMTEGKVLRWMKRPGDRVEVGEALAEIETDKVNVELPAEETGTLAEILVADGGVVPVGSPIAMIRRPGEEAGPGRGPSEEQIKASPVARRLARERGIDLAGIHGTGPEGRITKEDVEAFIAGRAGAPSVPERHVPSGAPVPPRPEAPPAPTPASPRTGAPTPSAADAPLTRIRQTIARRMTESKQQTPHFYVTVEILMDAALGLREQLNKDLGEKVVSVNDLVLKAAALALRTFLNLNASFAGETVRLHPEIHMGFALALPEGLIVPVIRHCDQKSIAEIAREAKDLGERARQGKLRPEELQGGTFTVSNLGMFDVESFAAIINPPQAAILAVGSAQSRAIADGGAVRAAHVMKATLSADHRVTDGAEAACYLGEVKRLLQNPSLLA